MELRPDQIEALKRIDEQSKLEKALQFDRRTAMLDDLLQESDIKQNLFDEIYKRADEMKLKFNMSLDDCEEIDYLVSDIISTTLKAVTSLKNVLIFV